MSRHLAMWQIHVFQTAFGNAYFPLKQHLFTQFTCGLINVFFTWLWHDLLLCYKCLFSAHKNLITTHTICGLFSFLWSPWGILGAMHLSLDLPKKQSRKRRCFRNWMQRALCVSVDIQWRQVVHMNILGPLAWVGSSILCCWSRQRAVATIAKGRARVSTMDSFLHTFSTWENSAVSQARLQLAKGMTERSTYRKRGSK